MADAFNRPTMASALYYQDPFAALDFLEKAFGFQRIMVITDDDGALAHAEMRYGDGNVMIGGEWTDYVASPSATGGRNTQTVHVQIDGDLDAHCARAQAAGAVVLRGPEDQFYGDRTYSARDPEGHVWSFAKNLRYVSREEAEKASGLNIEGWL